MLSVGNATSLWVNDAKPVGSWPQWFVIVVIVAWCVLELEHWGCLLGLDDLGCFFRGELGQSLDAVFAISGIDHLVVQVGAGRVGASAEIVVRVFAHGVLDFGDTTVAPVDDAQPERPFPFALVPPSGRVNLAPFVEFWIVLVDGYSWGMNGYLRKEARKSSRLDQPGIM
mgnify:CR=1 FL=1